ncbi:MAG: type I methionyl aminopeptidase [Fidelibacterota bacterium]
MVAIRSQKEIDLITESCQIVADTLIMLEKLIKPGVSLIALDQAAEDYIRSQGARPAFKGYMGFPSTLCLSVDDVVVHGIPSNRALKDGEVIGVDCGAEKNGYYGDSARTYSVGTIAEDKKELMRVTQEALMLGIEKARVGNHVSDIGHAIQTHVEKHGYSVVRELVGHGIGTQLHEEPQIPNYGLPNRGHKLRTGMVLAIEPMINMGCKEVFTESDGWTVKTQDGSTSAHFEHTIAITANGPKILSVGRNHG